MLPTPDFRPRLYIRCHSMCRDKSRSNSSNHNITRSTLTASLSVYRKWPNRLLSQCLQGKNFDLPADQILYPNRLSEEKRDRVIEEKKDRVQVWYRLEATLAAGGIRNLILSRRMKISLEKEADLLTLTKAESRIVQCICLKRDG